MAIEDILLGSERSIFYADGVTLSKEVDSDKGFKECCYINMVFGDGNSSDEDKNDYNGFAFQKQTDSDTCVFVLKNLCDSEDLPITDDTYGEFKDFGDIETNSEYTHFIASWKKILALKGIGTYQIEKTITTAGIPSVELSNSFELVQYNSTRSDGTVRLDCTMDGTLKHLGIDFKGTEFRDTARFKGKFGNQEESYTIEQLIHTNDEWNQVRMSQENEYFLKSKFIPEGITSLIFNFILLGNEIFANDYNLDNFSYKYKAFPVRFVENLGSEYFDNSRRRIISLKFSDRTEDVQKLNC